ncbi:unnamed protein product [Hymenolepis diminuta]|uniref:Uncharacterized protein n=1 Tax=Hymenolepis diminuta TaxID=6216 RepID=A0A564Z8B1_HYMDI|nr:unnamed protein product [Hymenolepis diminuta]
MPKVTITGCFKCVKYALFAFCLIAWILGLVAFIWGIVARTTGHFGPLETHLPAVTNGKQNYGIFSNRLLTNGLPA